MFEPALLQPIVTLLILVGAGLLCRALGLITVSGQKQLTTLIVNVFVPVMLFVAGMQADPANLVRQGTPVLLAGLLLPFLGYLIGMLLARVLKLPTAQASVVRVSAALCNTAFVGIPICTALWGAEGALLAAVYDQALTIPLLILAPMEYGRGSTGISVRSLVFGPLLWGLVLGIAAKLVGLSLPVWAAVPLNMISAATLPLSLILVGSLALPTQVGRGMARPLAAFVSSRLVFAPLATMAVVALLGLHGVGSRVMVLQTAMPASVIATVMAKEFNADADLAAAGALLSVALSAITLPVLVTLIALRGM